MHTYVHGLTVCCHASRVTTARSDHDDRHATKHLTPANGYWQRMVLFAFEPELAPVSLAPGPYATLLQLHDCKVRPACHRHPQEHRWCLDFSQHSIACGNFTSAHRPLPSSKRDPLQPMVYTYNLAKVLAD